jgi:hypothetical protein
LLCTRCEPGGTSGMKYATSFGACGFAMSTMRSPCANHATGNLGAHAHLLARLVAAGHVRLLSGGMSSSWNVGDRPWDASRP